MALPHMKMGGLWLVVALAGCGDAVSEASSTSGLGGSGGPVILSTNAGASTGGSAANETSSTGRGASGAGGGSTGGKPTSTAGGSSTGNAVSSSAGAGAAGSAGSPGSSAAGGTSTAGKGGSTTGGSSTGGTSGGSCSGTACSASTSCNATCTLDGPTKYCRSINGSTYGWIAQAFCGTASYPTGTTYACGGTVGTCCPNDNWEATCTCANGMTCAASSDCGATCLLDGATKYCRSFNGGAYGWVTQAVCGAAAYPVGTTYACGGTAGSCCPNDVWQATCTCANSMSCDASTSCGATCTLDGPTEYCRSINGGAYGWVTSAVCGAAAYPVGATYACGGTSGTCCPNDAWQATCTCANSMSCDASTGCGATCALDGPTEYCRSLNGAAYGWVTQAVCGSASYPAGTTYACGGTSGICCADGNWQASCP